MRLASLSLLLAALPALISAAASIDIHGPRGPARTERDADLTSWRGQDRIGEYTITAYAGDVIEFVRDALAPLGQVEGDDGLGKMTNAERLKRKLKIAKPAKMRRSGGNAPTRARPALAKRSSTWKRTCPVFAAGKSAWQHCHGGHSCSTSQAYECAIVDSFQDCHAGCGWGCASATYQQDTGYCFFYYDCCSDGLVQQYQ